MEIIANQKRSLLKALSWRLIITLGTILIVFLLTGNFAISLGVGAFEFGIKFLLYYLHERVWNKISWGRDK